MNEFLKATSINTLAAILSTALQRTGSGKGQGAMPATGTSTRRPGVSSTGAAKKKVAKPIPG